MKQLSEFDALAEANNYEHTEYVTLTRDQVNGALLGCGLYGFVKTQAEAGNEILMALLDTSKFDFDPNSAMGKANLALFDALKGGFVDQPEVVAAIGEAQSKMEAEAQVTTKPYGTATQAQFNVAKGIYPASKSVDWSLEGHIIVTLNKDVSEPVSPYLTIKNAVYATPERIGRTRLLHNAGRYPIPLNGLGYLRAGTITVSLPLNADFSIEVA